MIYNFFFKAESAYRISLLRIFIALFMFWKIDTIKIDFFISRNNEAFTYLPIGVFRLLETPLSDAAFDNIYYAWIGFTVLAGIGLLSRISIPLWFLSSLFVFGYANCFGKVGHSSIMMVLTLLILCFSRCTDVLSLDSIVLKKKAVDKSWVYRWPIALIQSFVILTFFTLGLQKILSQGFHWAFSDGLFLVIFEQPIRTALGEWILNQPPLISMLLAAYALFVVELLSPLAFIKPFKYVYPILWASLHIGICFAMGGFKIFFSQIVIYTCFYNFPKIALSLKKIIISRINFIAK